MDSEKILEAYYDHYKETTELSRQAQRRRNRSYVCLCALETIAFLMASNRSWITSLLNKVIEAKLGQPVSIGDNPLCTLVWILIAFVLMRYVQDVVYIERQYSYIDILERVIAELAGNTIFRREGKQYLANYPLVLNLVDFFYKGLSPAIFLVINVALMWQEWHMGIESLLLLCDTVIFIIITVMATLYFLYTHPRWVRTLRRLELLANAEKRLKDWLRRA